MNIQEKPVRQLPLVQQVEQILIERIRNKRYPPDRQIPNEEELSAEFKVSRATIRSALNTLSTLGLVVRRQGAGTFVTRMPPISNPLDQAFAFQELIGSNNSRTAVQHVYCSLERAKVGMAGSLQIPLNSEVLVSHKIFTADDEPVIFCINTLSVDLFKPTSLKQILITPEILEPFFEFVENETGLRVEFYIARIRPVKASKCSFHGHLPLPSNTPILEIDEVAYTLDNQPIFHTYEYHPENKMSFELIRHAMHRSGRQSASSNLISSSNIQDESSEEKNTNRHSNL